MNCPYCGELINNNETFCPKCGNRLINHSITSNIEISDTKELDTFIDKNISKLKSKSFSLPSFFLGSLYYLYRKMYILAILILSLSMAYSIGIYFILDDYKLYVSLIYLVFSILINIVIAIKFNSLYITHANKKISKIKNKYKNSTRFEVMERIKYAGSTNLLAPILALIIVTGITYFINFKMNNVEDKLSNNEYSVADGYRETSAIISLNEDKSFIWYSNKNEKSDNFYVGKYTVYVGNNAIREAKRYDLKGRNEIGALRKYYFTDAGLRNARLDFAFPDERQIFENIIYNELLYHGYSVSVGSFDSIEKNAAGKSVRKTNEVDFFARKGIRQYYIQVSLDIANPKTKARELRPYFMLDDQVKKIIVINRPVKESLDENGFTIIGVEDFLLRFIKL